MLDTPTRRRIDLLRDILVGKVPDPKSQVEQITIALIYKFMDDMDAEAEIDLGGKRKFFAGEFQKYSWPKLMRSGLGGNETLNLYAEAIAKMPQNPGIPPLFREIFKNAYLPYRDPETLKGFLKIIDQFDYDHSEKLGDAYEHLLQVLGSQGDAGQFRTPRNIIDFIVAVVDPKKHESIMDPACGTAGFLISAYRHIQNANSDADGNSTLIPDERERLARNVKGYDISPDMVRLSLVNLYLHGFPSPQIFEYDTLTTESRWGETAEVIFANPPFMSPKGGIKPHKRFSIQAKRSEVLFVDYIAEHLSPQGRAGIIVPEGIIFQSQTAYVALRKLLVENSLVAVISLPSGVFNPYSGVKTSILILDKSLAKQATSIAFFKIENDGFGLGAQRREIDKNDLPKVKTEIETYLNALRNHEPTSELRITTGQIVSKMKLAAIGDYNLSGERYREGTSQTNSFPLKRIAEVCTVNPRKSELNELAADTLVSFVPMTDLNEYRISFEPSASKTLSEVTTSYTYFQNQDVLLAKVTPCFENGKAGIARKLLNGIGFGSSEFYVFRCNEQVLPEWVYFCVMHPKFRESAIAQMTGTGGLQRVPRDYVENFLIPLPPLDVQKKIVAEIEGYQKVITGARAVIDNYHPHIPVKSDWPIKRLGEIAEIIMGQSPPGESYNSRGKGTPLINGPVEFGPEPFSRTVITQHTTNPRKMCREGDLILCVRGSTTGRMNIAGYTGCIGRGVAAIRSAESQDWINFVVNTLRDRIYNLGVGSTFPNISSKDIAELEIPLPPIATRQAIVAEIEKEQMLVAANRELIARFEKKIQTTLARVWGEEKPAPPDLV